MTSLLQVLRSVFPRAGSSWLPGVLVVAILLSLAGCSTSGKDTQGLLSGRSAQARGVLHAERVNDGEVPPVGSAWNSNRTAIFPTRQSYIEFDLGREKKLDSVFVLADNNDDYEVTFSKDGKAFERLWLARRVRDSGMRWRKVSGLDKSGRYVRLTPKNGDQSLSVAEFSVHEAPVAEVPGFKEVPAEDLSLYLRHALLLFATAALLAVAFASASAGILWNTLMFALLGAGAFHLLRVFREAFPPDQLEVSLARGVAAAVALGVVARETYGRRYKPLAPLNVVTLGMCAVLAVGAFFNLGHPQFYDHENKEPSVVHNFDMRVYFPVAKYFDELKYDGLYLASVASYAEEHGGLQSRRIQETELRDLRDHRMRKVKDVMPEVEGIRGRFSPARWEMFKKDMSYFWKTMGDGGYLGSMRDHGGNATPVWLTIAYVMFKSAPASNEVLQWTGLLDPLLLLIFAISVWRTFGVRTALVSLVVFGANDFYMFGSNWAGATLRNDWMVYLGLGACALYAKHYRLGGALLAFSALIRAFPAISLLALGVPVAYYLVERYRAEGALPSVSRIFHEQRWFFEAALGATAFVVVAVGLSSAVLGVDAWPLWVKKISSFTASPHVNHISLLTVTSGSEGNQFAVQQARLPLHVAATAVYLLLAIWCMYKRPPHVAALLGILMMPVLMYPANYYIHFVFLLPLLVTEPGLVQRRFAREASGRVWMLTLGLCAAQYFTVRETALDMHFYNASVLLMVATLGILIALLPRDREGLVLVPIVDAPPEPDGRLSEPPGSLPIGEDASGVGYQTAGSDTQAVDVRESPSEPSPEDGAAPQESERDDGEASRGDASRLASEGNSAAEVAGGSDEDADGSKEPDPTSDDESRS